MAIPRFCQVISAARRRCGWRLQWQWAMASASASAVSSGLGTAGQVQKDAGHLLDLLFHRLAVAGHRLLDLHGGVLAHLHTGLGRRQQNHAAGLGHTDDGGLVVLVIQLFNGQRLRLVAVQDVGHAVVDLHQPLLKRGVFVGADGAVGRRREPVARVIQNPPAHNGIAGVDAQYPHLSLSLHFVRYTVTVYHESGDRAIDAGENRGPAAAHFLCICPIFCTSRPSMVR